MRADPCWRFCWVRLSDWVLGVDDPDLFCQFPLWVRWETFPARSEATLLGRFEGVGRAPEAPWARAGLAVRAAFDCDR